MAQNKRWRWWRFNPMMGSLSHLHGWVRFSWNCIDATLQALPLRTISFVTKFIIILLNITCESSSPSSSIACEINISTPAVVFSAFGIIFIVYCILYIVYMMFWSQANVTSMRLWACRSPAVTYFVVVTCANIFRGGLARDCWFLHKYIIVCPHIVFVAIIYHIRKLELRLLVLIPNQDVEE